MVPSLHGQEEDGVLHQRHLAATLRDEAPFGPRIRARAEVAVRAEETHKSYLFADITPVLSDLPDLQSNESGVFTHSRTLWSRRHYVFTHKSHILADILNLRG